MFFTLADTSRRPARQAPVVTAWRWRFFDPRTGEQVTHSEPLTAEQVRAINPRAELIPGSRVEIEGAWSGF
jgi:hypothetical protein